MTKFNKERQNGDSQKNKSHVKNKESLEMTQNAVSEVQSAGKAIQKKKDFDVFANPNELHMIPLGGCNPDGIGMNSTVYFYKNRSIIVDLGVTFENTPGVDLLMPNMGYMEDKMHTCEGIVVTHAHEDHIGGVPYLWEKLKRPKIYATPFTGTVLLNKFIGLMGRNFDKSAIVIIQKGGSIQLGPFDVKFISITHSVPDSNALMIKTDAGNLLHTGDWKIDDTPVVGEKTDYCAFEEASKDGILAVIGDSTNIFREEQSGSEEGVGEALTSLIKNCKTGKVAVVCFASNVHRIASIIQAAVDCGRQPVFVGRSVNLFSEVAAQFDYLKESLSKAVVNHDSVKNLSSDKILLICTGSQGEERAALSRMAFGKHPWFGLDSGDTVIFSSRVIPGNEKSVGLVHNKLCRMGVKVYTGDINRDLHVSGHPARSELKQLYSILKPQICIPIHGEDRHLARHAEFAKEMGFQTAVLHNGDVLKINKEGPVKVGSVRYGKLFKDGKELMNRDSYVMIERTRMMASGSVHISLLLNNDGDCLSVEVSSIGLKEKWHRINGEMKKSIIDVLENAERAGGDAEKIRDLVYLRVDQMLKNRLDKSPGISIHTHKLKI